MTSGRRSSRSRSVLVGVSIDGPREIHDTYRVDKGGKGSFDRVMAGLGHLREHDVEWNALTTIHAANQDRGQGGLPVPARRVRRPVHAVHPDRRTRDLRDVPDRERGMGRGREGPTPLHAGGEPGHRAVDLTGGLRPVPDRRVRGMGPPRRRRGLRPDVRRGPGQLARRAAGPLRAFGDLRAGARARAHRRPLLVRPLRRARATSSATSRTSTCSS